MNPIVSTPWRCVVRLAGLVAALLLTNAAIAATWEPLMRTSNGVWTINTDSIGGAPLLRTGQALYTPQAGAAGAASAASGAPVSQLISYEVQCGNRQLRRTGVVLQQEGQPDKPGNWPMEPAFASPKPDTVGEDIVVRLCDVETTLALANSPAAWEPLMNSANTGFQVSQASLKATGNRRLAFVMSQPLAGSTATGPYSKARLLAMSLQCDTRQTRVLWARDYATAEPVGPSRRLDSPPTAWQVAAANTMPAFLLARSCDGSRPLAYQRVRQTDLGRFMEFTEQAGPIRRFADILERKAAHGRPDQTEVRNLVVNCQNSTFASLNFELPGHGVGDAAISNLAGLEAYPPPAIRRVADTASVNDRDKMTELCQGRSGTPNDSLVSRWATLEANVSRYASSGDKQRADDARAREEAARLKQFQAEAAAREAAEAARLAKEYPYFAVLTCTTNGMAVNFISCLYGDHVGTEVELRNGDDYKLWQGAEFSNAHEDFKGGKLVNLRQHFQISAQNAGKDLILGMKVIERASGRVIYEKQVSRFGAMAFAR